MNDALQSKVSALEGRISTLEQSNRALNTNYFFPNWSSNLALSNISGSQASLWTENGTDIYPTNSVDRVLVGLTSSDVTYAAGQIISSSLVEVVSATVNASFVGLSITAGTEVRINSGATGTGTLLPLSFYTNNARQVTITTGGVTIAGGTSTDLFGSASIVSLGNAVGCMTASANASVVYLFISTSIETTLKSDASGSGTRLPFSIYTGGSRSVTITTAGNLLVGMLSSDQPGSGVFVGAGQNIFATDSVGVVTASTNASSLYFSSTGSVMAIVCDKTGTGTQRPLTFNMAATEVGRFDTAGMLSVGFAGDASLSSAGRVLSSLDFIVATNATANASFVRIIIVSSVARLESSIIGTGTFLPLSFWAGGNEAARFQTDKSLLVGFTSTDLTTGLGTIVSASLLLTSAAANASNFTITLGSTVFFNATHTGTGANLPLTFNVGGVGESARMQTGRSWLFGLASSDLADSLGRIVSGADILCATATANASFIRIGTIAGTAVFIQSNVTGTGTQLPIDIYYGNTQAMRILSATRVLVARTTDDGSGAVLQVAGNISVNGTVLTVP